MESTVKHPILKENTFWLEKGYRLQIFFNQSITLKPSESKQCTTGLKSIKIPTDYKMHFGKLYATQKAEFELKQLSVLNKDTLGDETNVTISLKNTSNKTVFLTKNEANFSVYFSKSTENNNYGVPFVLKIEQDTIQDPRLKLIELANSYDISATATSYMVQAVQPSLKIYNVNAENYREGLDKKLYIPIYLNGYRVVACLDSGSDLTIMQLSLYNKIFNKRKLDPCSIPHIKSFSNNDIKVIGQVTCETSFKKGYNGKATLTIIVIGNINNQIPTFLFGNDSFKACLATLGYTGFRKDPEPEFILNIPEPLKIPVYQASPSDIMSCTAEYCIKPYETKDIEVALHPAAPVLRTFEVLITSYTYDTVQVIPSKSGIEYDSDQDRYYASACIVNLSHLPQEGTLSARVEIIPNHDDFSTYKISLDKKESLLKLMSEKPPAREILPDNLTNNLFISVPTVSRVDLNRNGTPLSDEQIFSENTKPSDNNEVFAEEDILLGNSVSYSGEAILEPQVTDGGLEIPTLIHSTAEEALNLELFEPEIRPYLEDIFLKKYPEVVSLHPLDAGDVSKTLGYTTLRLIPGESLPRHKRIYQLSQRDSNYLEQLLEQFIHFNYVRRAPIDSTDIHLYGMSTYLVPRKKETDIARLVIDFSPLTSIIQSPPSVVPDITASLQRLQGKGIFSEWIYDTPT